MAQVKALNALEPFLALTKSATSPRAAADLITQATSNPNTYVFAELLERPEIQALSGSPEYSSYLKLLEIFSYGTYAEYTSTANLPSLNDAQVLKLRQLSLLTFAEDPLNFTYAALQQSLALPDTRAVEDLMISAIYAGLIDAQLDPCNRVVHVSSIAPLRDLAPGSIPPIIETLRTWSDRCTSTLAELEEEIALIKANAAKINAEKKKEKEQQARLIDMDRHGVLPMRTPVLARALAKLSTQGQRFGKRSSGSLEAGADDDEFMDVDDDEVDEAGDGGPSGSAGPGKKRASRRKL